MSLYARVVGFDASTDPVTPGRVAEPLIDWDHALPIAECFHDGPAIGVFVDVEGHDPRPEEGWLWDGEGFTEPAPVEPPKFV